MDKRILGAIGMAALAVAAPAAADVKTGVDAWKAGDYRAAVEQWRGPAIAGDADAEFNLGQAYKLGRGVPVDPALAESWFRKAALQGHLQAEDNYGLALFQADRKSEAVPWLEKSVARGEPRAQLVLGTMLFNGDGVAKDWPRAYALMTRASQSGLQSASQTLSQMDQYISPADRERGTAMAAQYAAQAKAQPAPAPRRAGSIANVDVPPSRIADAAPRPMPRPAAPMTHAAPSPAPRPPVIAHASPEPRPAPVHAAPAGGHWRVQLGAFHDAGNAQVQWAKVRGRMTGSTPSYEKAGAVTRLVAGPFGSRADATRACAAAKSAGSACVVLAP
nr:SPOR domain-containing protein [Sphingomonas sp. CROZ-RG-20F-R02-07]